MKGLPVREDHKEGIRGLRQLRIEANENQTFSALKRKGEAIRREEVEESFRRLPNITEEEKEVIEILSKRIVERIFYEPTKKLRDLPTQKQVESYYKKALKELFSLEDI